VILKEDGTKASKKTCSMFNKEIYLEPLTDLDIPLDFRLVNLGLVLLRLLAVN